MRPPIARLTMLVLLCDLSSSCAYVLPASWRAFRADPDDAPPAITRALDSRNIGVADWDQANRSITTHWVQTSSGTSRSRARYIIRWEKDAREETLTVYVRHEAQDQDVDLDGAAGWGPVYHEGGEENALLDLIAKELAASNESPPPPAPENGEQAGSDRGGH